MAHSDAVDRAAAPADRAWRRLGVAREVLALARRALQADGRVELFLVEDAPAERSAAARTWRIYMAAARRGFEDGSLDVAQLLLARSHPEGPAELPLRPWWQG